MARSVVLSAAAAAVVLSLAVGCAGGGGSEGGANAQSGAGAKGSVLKTIRIQETEYSLKPADITLKKPGLYALKVVNTGSTTHALEVDGEGLEEYSEKIGPGQSTRMKLDLSKAGTYELTDPLDHQEGKGMEGRLIVKEGSGSQGGY
jgi:uncharacterized cupredoxin-like copper-binding protein